MTADKFCDNPCETTPRPWTSKELAELRRLAPLGLQAIATVLGRTPNAVRQVAHRHRISLRRPGSAAGLVLGQPRGTSWKSSRDASEHVAVLRLVREQVLAGDVDPARLERLATRATRVARGAPLCPLCVRNPQERPTTGLCEDCHLRQLAQAHRDDAALKDAQRELWRERQGKHRSRKNPPPPEGTTP